MYMGFPGGSDNKESVMQETWVQFLVQEEPVGEENGYPVPYSYLEYPMDRGAWQAIVHWYQRGGQSN